MASVEMKTLDHRSQVVGVVVHVMTVLGLGRATVPAPVRRDHTNAVLKEEQHTWVSQSSADSGPGWLNTIG